MKREQYIIAALFFCALPLTAWAGTAEVRAFAREQGCSVTNITPLTMETGETENSAYKVSCALPAGMTEQEKKDNGTLTVRCDDTLCTLMKKGE